MLQLAQAACYPVMDFPEAMLGGMTSFTPPPAFVREQLEECSPIHEGEVVINGVVLPRNVVEELRLLGMPLASYTRGELQAANMACAIDGELIDDPNGNSFLDKLQLTEAERYAQEERKFGKQIKREREWQRMRVLSDDEEDRLYAA